jgi:hypothetical protein
MRKRPAAQHTLTATLSGLRFLPCNEVGVARVHHLEVIR